MSFFTHILTFLNLLFYCSSQNNFMNGEDNYYRNFLPFGSQSCYNKSNPIRCFPPFENAAVKATIEATSTCGINKVTDYCPISRQYMSRRSDNSSCLQCFGYEHRPEYMNDYNINGTTWWQSETMYDGVVYPKVVNITLHLGKQYDITHITTKFVSPRPESLAIYKKFNDSDDWIPFQYYSTSCLDTFNVSQSTQASRSDETAALCSKEFSAMSPLTGGQVVFITLKGRPSYREFETNEKLQKFVTATDIRISLIRHNTFGDEIFQDKYVLQTYYYAISDISIGARCKCNGHGNFCEKKNESYTCICFHNTTGRECDRCQDFFQDQPWLPATASNANPCVECKCNNRSNKCVFDEELWLKTKHGGRCLNCSDNTDGPMCEHCVKNFYRNSNGDCVDCRCDKTGSIDLQCNNGTCNCKPGVMGDKCDRCQPNFFNFTEEGCKPCECSEIGSIDSKSYCNNNTGECSCKLYVSGRKCDYCNSGYFDLSKENPLGCLPCFCYGHSSTCASSPGYSKSSIESHFTSDFEGWTAEDREGNPLDVNFDLYTKSLTVRAPFSNTAYIIAPKRFLGNQKASYNQDLTFNLWVNQNTSDVHFYDIIIEGANISISHPMMNSNTRHPTNQPQSYRFRLHEHKDYGWFKKLKSGDFISVLANITKIKIRVVYSYGGIGYINDIRLESAQQDSVHASGQDATWIESCTCPKGYTGQFCESCAPGFRRDPPNSGPFSYCVPCKCNNHSTECDPDSGDCLCNDNTTGSNCEICARGFYGNALQGRKDDCKPCLCPNRGACVVLPDESVACLECPEGYGGAKCELCLDGYYGDPLGHSGSSLVGCQKCNCNENIDENAIGNCNTTTGECLKCAFNTYGPHCEKCLPGYFGNALIFPKGNCQFCNCHPNGTRSDNFNQDDPSIFFCDENTGQCDCKDNVEGSTCDKCFDGYWGLNTVEGCRECNCNLIGSYNNTCNDDDGYCNCKPGVQGISCSECLPNHYGFSEKGCIPCDCGTGSRSKQCNENGQCSCYRNFEGKKCDRCRENTYLEEGICTDCPPCYYLVQDAVVDYREKIYQLQTITENINTSAVTEDDNFELRLNETLANVTQLRKEINDKTKENRALAETLLELENRTRRASSISESIASRFPELEKIALYAFRNITEIEKILKNSEHLISETRKHLDIGLLEVSRNKIEIHDPYAAEMSGIAQNALEIVKDIEQQAEVIESVVAEAISTANKALDSAMETIKLQNSTKLAIKKIQPQLNEIEEHLNNVKNLALKAKNEASMNYNISLTAYTQAKGLSVPEYDNDKLIEKIDQIANDAEQLISEADKLLEKHFSLKNITEIYMKDTKDSLAEVTKKQKILDELFTFVNKAKEKVLNASSSSNETLNVARETLNTLRAFDEVVKKSQTPAEEAFQKIPEIKKILQDLNVNINSLEQILETSKNVAFEAKGITQEAETLAKEAFENAANFQKHAEDTKTMTLDLKNQTEHLINDIEKTSNKINALGDKFGYYERSVKEAAEKANKARQNANDAKLQVQEAYEEITDISKTLASTYDFDENALEEIYQRYKEAEQKFKHADLEDRINKMKNSENELIAFIKDLGEETNQLREDVDNLQQISATIPANCFGRSELEPPMSG